MRFFNSYFGWIIIYITAEHTRAVKNTPGHFFLRQQQKKQRGTKKNREILIFF